MPRIRTIKPEFWVDEKVVELDPWARLLFIGLWNFADDQGFVEYSPKRIKMQIFPGDTTDVAPLLASLLECGLLAAYDSPIGRVLHVQSWARHQKVSNPAAPRFDPAELEPINLSDESIPYSSRALARALCGKERKGKEVTNLALRVVPDEPLWDDEDPVAIAPPPTKRPAPPEGFERWWAIYPKKDAKGAARKAWANAAKKTDLATLIAAAEKYRDDPARETRYTKNPATWLNGECWLNEPASHQGPRGDPRATPASNAPERIAPEQRCPDHRDQRAGTCRHCAARAKAGTP